MTTTTSTPAYLSLSRSKNPFGWYHSMIKLVLRRDLLAAFVVFFLVSTAAAYPPVVAPATSPVLLQDDNPVQIRDLTPVAPSFEWWKQEPLSSNDEACSICGDGRRVTAPMDIFQFADSPAIRCGYLEYIGASGLIPDGMCDLSEILNILNMCGCVDETPNTPITYAPGTPDWEEVGEEIGVIYPSALPTTTHAPTWKPTAKPNQPSLIHDHSPAAPSFLMSSFTDQFWDPRSPSPVAPFWPEPFSVQIPQPTSSPTQEPTVKATEIKVLEAPVWDKPITSARPPNYPTTLPDEIDRKKFKKHNGKRKKGKFGKKKNRKRGKKYNSHDGAAKMVDSEVKINETNELEINEDDGASKMIDSKAKISETDELESSETNERNKYKLKYVRKLPHCDNITCFDGINTLQYMQKKCDGYESCDGFSFSTNSETGSGCLKECGFHAGYGTETHDYWEKQIFAELGEKCDGFDGNVGKPYPSCKAGLNCEYTFEFAFPGSRGKCVLVNDNVRSKRDADNQSIGDREENRFFVSEALNKFLDEFENQEFYTVEVWEYHGTSSYSPHHPQNLSNKLTDKDAYELYRTYFKEEILPFLGAGAQIVMEFDFDEQYRKEGRVIRYNSALDYRKQLQLEINHHKSEAPPSFHRDIGRRNISIYFTTLNTQDMPPELIQPPMSKLPFPPTEDDPTFLLYHELTLPPEDISKKDETLSSSSSSLYDINEIKYEFAIPLMTMSDKLTSSLKAIVGIRAASWLDVHAMTSSSSSSQFRNNSNPNPSITQIRIEIIPSKKSFANLQMQPEWKVASSSLKETSEIQINTSYAKPISTTNLYYYYYDELE